MITINMTAVRASLLTFLLLLGLASFGLTACERQGPAEKAGERIDDAVEDASDKVEDVVDDVKDSVDN